MYLERLEIHGFKSFAHKTTLHFETRAHTRPGITAIVGPNGSGKSNVADALRWVLGEQSMKMLRGKKTEDIIFSGSNKKARLGLAEVSLSLNNEDKRAPIDYTQLTITRRLYRDGESVYLLNNNKVRLQDIQLLLAKTNIGQRTYSVIGQGMVEEILLVSPRERKEFFDEAAGVKQYIIKKDQAVQKLALTQENVRQAETLMQEIEPRLRSLTRQVKRLERREAVEKELHELQQKYYGGLLHHLETDRGSRIADRDSIAEQRKKKEEELHTIQQEIKKLEQEETQSEAFLTLQRQYEELNVKRNTLRDEEFELKTDLIKVEGTAKTKITIPLPEITVFLQRFQTEQNSLIDELLAANTVTSIEQLKPKFQKLRDDLSSFTRRFQTHADDTDAKKKTIEGKLKTIVETVASLATNLASVQRQLEKLSTEEKEKKSVFFTLQRSLQEKQTAVNTLVQQENDIRIECAKLDQRKEDLERETKNEGVVLSSLSSQPAPIEASGERVGVRSQDEATTFLPEIQKLKHQLELIGGIDPEAMTEYQQTKERFDFLSNQSNDLKKATASLESAIQELEETIKTQFDLSFHNINSEFEKFFKILFGGGHSKLVIVKDIPPQELPVLTNHAEMTDNAETESRKSKVESQKSKMLKPVIVGIDIHATPPGKRLKGIQMLSGGERALTAIALICAFIAHNPSPFVVLDEVDAALDEANSDRFARILDELSSKTQFITITHNRTTMHRAAILYGVTMGEDGISKILSVRLDDAPSTGT